MGGSYIVKIDLNYKKWITKKSILDDVSIYSVFEKTLYPFFLEHSKGDFIDKITFSEDTSTISLSLNMKKTLKLEAYERNTNVVSLVNAVFRFYLENNPETLDKL